MASMQKISNSTTSFPPWQLSGPHQTSTIQTTVPPPMISPPTYPPSDGNGVNKTQTLRPFVLNNSQATSPQASGNRIGTLESTISPHSSLYSDEDSIDSAAKSVAYITLEAAAEPHYVGPASGFLWASMILGGMQGAGNVGHKLEAKVSKHEPISLGSVEAKSARAHATSQIKSLSPEVAAVVFEAVYRHIQPRYPFMDWVETHQMWTQREAILLAVSQNGPLDKGPATAAFFILMIHAIGSQLCGKLNLPGLAPHEVYFTKAAPYLNVIVQLHNLANIQGLLILAVYSLRNSKAPSVWYLSGIVIRLCIGMGLHRKVTAHQFRGISKYKAELRKRVFWTAYIFDRMMALSLGRPPGISDWDIDVDLPDDMDCVESLPQLDRTCNTSMSSAIHYIQLKRIESLIQRTVYRVDETDAPQSEVWRILGLLDDWEKSIPKEASAPNCWSLPCCSRDWFMLKAAEVRLYLLRPLTVDAQSGGMTFLPHLAKYAAAACEIQKSIHQQDQPMSNSSLHSTFLCGLTLLHAVFLKPDIMPQRDVFKSIRANSNTLFAYSQHYKAAEVLYNVFEDLASSCLDRLNNPPPPLPERLDPFALNPAIDEWQKTLSDMTDAINSATHGEFATLLESLGMPNTASDLERPLYDTFPEPVFGLDTDPFSLNYLLSMVGDNDTSDF